MAPCDFANLASSSWADDTGNVVVTTVETESLVVVTLDVEPLLPQAHKRQNVVSRPAKHRPLSLNRATLTALYLLGFASCGSDLDSYFGKQPSEMPGRLFWCFEPQNETLPSTVSVNRFNCEGI